MITAVELYIFLRISVTLSEFHSYSGIKYSELQSFFFVVFFFLSVSLFLSYGRFLRDYFQTICECYTCNKQSFVHKCEKNLKKKKK